MPKPFGVWLAEKIEQRGTNKNQLAKKAGVSRSHMNNIVAGLKGVGSETLRAIAEALNIPAGEVFRAWAESESGEEISYAYGLVGDEAGSVKELILSRVVKQFEIVPPSERRELLWDLNEWITQEIRKGDAPSPQAVAESSSGYSETEKTSGR